MKKWIFLIILLLTLIPMTYAQSCSDSDGLNYYTKGTVTFDSKTYTDNCANDEVLIEGYCNNGFKTTTYYCPEGCLNGVCLSQTPAPVDQECFILLSTMDESSLLYCLALWMNHLFSISLISSKIMVD